LKRQDFEESNIFILTFEIESILIQSFHYPFMLRF